MLAIEGSGELGAAKKAKAEDPDKEVAGCATCLALAAAGKPTGSDKQYCKIHHTKGHDLQNCRQVELLAEKQKAEYERRDKEKGRDGTEGSGEKRGGQGVAAAKITNKRGLLGAATRKRRMMITMRTTSTSSRRLQRLCASTVAPRCTPHTAS